MLNQRLEAARAVATRLQTAELDSSTALKSVSALMTASLDARERVSGSAVFGQDALDHMAAAVGRITEGLRSLRDAHVALKQHRTEAGLSAYSFGDESESPTGIATPSVDHQPRHLQAVG